MCLDSIFCFIGSKHGKSDFSISRNVTERSLPFKHESCVLTKITDDAGNRFQSN